jgi:hypothetical protein
MSLAFGLDELHGFWHFWHFLIFSSIRLTEEMRRPATGSASTLLRRDKTVALPGHAVAPIWRDKTCSFQDLSLRLTATDCDAVRLSFALKAFGATAGRLPGAEGWQKDKPGRKMGLPWFFRHSIFPPETTSAFVRLFHNFSI